MANSFERLWNTILNQTLDTCIQKLQELNAVKSLWIKLFLKLDVIRANSQFFNFSGILLNYYIIDLTVQALYIFDNLFQIFPIKTVNQWIDIQKTKSWEKSHFLIEKYFC